MPITRPRSIVSPYRKIGVRGHIVKGKVTLHRQQLSGNKKSRNTDTVTVTDTDTVTVTDIVDSGQSAVDQVHPPQHESKYTSEKKNCLQTWEKLRQQMLKVGRSQQVPARLSCHACQRDTEHLFRCLDCAAWQELCQGCLEGRHQFPHLHLFESWRNGTYVSVSGETPMWTSGCNKQGCSYEKDMVVVDDKGRQHIRRFQFCRCELEPITLIRFGLWPASPKLPKLAFHMDLLRWIHGLSIECHLSVKGFCEALRARLPKQHQCFVSLEVKSIYKVLMKETLEEFRYFLYNMNHLHQFHPALNNGAECAACYKMPTKIISLDADFQLVRKVSSGSSWGKSKHSSFFLEQEEVDEFISSYNADSKKPNVDCSDFQAGNSLRGKNKTAKLSETAVFGSACRHDFPQLFFSLKHGERLGYSVFLIEKLLEKSQTTTNMHIMYDIACVLHSHLQKSPHHSDLVNKIKLSVPIFHSYGHKRSCQVLYSPRRTEGAGLSDGEGLERLWSYLGKFANITKEMTPENRIDLLSDALLHFGQNIQDRFATTLVRRHEKATEMEQSSKAALGDLLAALPGADVGSVERAIEEERLAATQKSVPEPLSMEEEYCVTIEKLNKLRSDNLNRNKQEQRLENKVRRMMTKKNLSDLMPGSEQFLALLSSARQKKSKSLLIKLRQQCVEKVYLQELNKKYSRGQSISIRLSRQMKTSKSYIDKTITEFNAINTDHLTYEHVMDLNNPLWHGLSSNSSPVTSEAIQLYFLAKRSCEEQDLLKQEMKSVLSWYLDQHMILQQLISHCDRVEKSLFFQEGLFLERQLHVCSVTYEKFVGKISVPTMFTDIVGTEIDNFSHSFLLQQVLECEHIVHLEEEEIMEDDEFDLRETEEQYIDDEEDMC